MQASEEVLGHHECPICLYLLIQPVRLNKCHHLFCRACLEDSNELSGKQSCPLCRDNFVFSDMHNQVALESELLKLYPQTILYRKQNQVKKYRVKLMIGNHTKIIDNDLDNKYEWTFYLKAINQPLHQYAQKIEVLLHPTFSPSKIQFSANSPIEFKRLGWGTFCISVKIHWKKKFQQQISLISHELQFIPTHETQVVCHLHDKIKSK